MTFCGDLPFVPPVFTITFLRTFAAEASLPRPETTVWGQTAKVFACFWAKVLRDVHFTLDWRRRLWLSLPRRQGLKQVNGTGHNNGQAPAATT
ncbi:hypothetical protein ABVN74_00540 [Escherichia coli]